MIFNLKGPERESAIQALEARVHHVFKDQSLLQEALTHPSYASEQESNGKQNQRLEFLGDAVLQIVLSEYLFLQDSDSQEGVLTRMRSYLAKEEATAHYALELGLDRLLLLGHGECQDGGRERSSLQGDVFEAFLGALYLDGGYEVVKALVLSLLPSLESVRHKLILEENPKGALQELCQAGHLGKLEYCQISKHGPVHAPVYVAGVFLQGQEIGRGEANSLRNAEKIAAQAAWLRLQGMEENMGDIYALDFDGVICDSVRETAMSGWKAARQLWPELFVAEWPSEEQVEAFRRVRPWLETGFDSIILTKLLQEQVPLSEFQADFPGHAARVMTENKLEKQQLITLFGQTRDQWIQEDLDSWLGAHGFFNGVIDALKTALAQGKKILILTTKQERFVHATLKNQGVDFPVENIYGLDRKRKKEELLLELLRQKPPHLYFVEDRLKTLLRVEAVHELESVQLKYADWGYGTAQDLDAALADPHIHTMHLQEFNDWLSGKK